MTHPGNYTQYFSGLNIDDVTAAWLLTLVGNVVSAVDQTARDAASAAQTTATAANTNASTALSTATTAQSTANAADTPALRNAAIAALSSVYDALGAASTAQAFAIQRANHTGTQPVSTITGLGGAATLNVGTASGTVAAGDDSRITGAAVDSAVVHLANTETISGVKTFSAQNVFSNQQFISGIRYSNSVVTANSTLSTGAGTTTYVNSASATTQTLPAAASTVAGRRFTIVNVNTGVVTVSVSGGGTINGATTYTLSGQYKRVTVECGPAALNNWYVVENN